jgi:hypothetical protein
VIGEIVPTEIADNVISVTDMSYTDFLDGWNFYGGDLIDNGDGITDSDTLMMDEVAERSFSPCLLIEYKWSGLDSS